MKTKKKVYVAFGADYLHRGHMNVLKIAKKYGDVIVGLMTDNATVEYTNLPHFLYEQREAIFKKINLVSKIMPQATLDYTENLKKIKPHYVVHGDDWKNGPQRHIRKKVINQLKKWSGKLIEVKYTPNIPSSELRNRIINTSITPDVRKSKLNRLLKVKKLVRILECHNPLAGLIVENLSLVKNRKFFSFDGMWSSSLTDSVSRGKPDNQSIDFSTRINGASEIFDVTTKPLIFDADNGGRIEHLKFFINRLEKIGISAIVLEDKVGLKRNSLFEDQKDSRQDTISNFSRKIKTIAQSRISNDFMIVARIESFILKKGLRDAIKRANAYSKAGADAILIHSKNNSPNEIFSFAKVFAKSKYYKPLVAVPSTYSKTTEKNLEKNGFRIVIYANHMLRASYPSMMTVAQSILKNQRSFPAEKNLESIKKILNLIK